MFGVNMQRKMLKKLNHFFSLSLLKSTATVVVRKCDEESDVTMRLAGYVLLQMAGTIFGMSNSRNPLKPSGHYMYRTVVTICTASLTFSSSTFCPHSVFMCFVWI